jgi:sugar phosphate isomerase/epimerase
MRPYSLAYLTVNASTAPETVTIAAQWGYDFVGFRLQANAPGAPFQSFIDSPTVQRETLARMADTGVKVFDLEIIRIGEQFDPLLHRPLLEAGAALKARAVLVAADDSNEARLATHFAQLCEFMQPYGLTADLEFMPWTGVKDAQAALRVLKAAGTPSNAGILVDALHYGRSTSTLADIAAIPKSLLHYAQICDAEQGLHFSTQELIHTARQERSLPGEGTIDLKGLFATLPPDLPVSVEVPSLSRSSQVGDSAWAKRALDSAKIALHQSL